MGGSHKDALALGHECQLQRQRLNRTWTSCASPRKRLFAARSAARTSSWQPQLNTCDFNATRAQSD
eukprot:2227968-Pleurochrysis_carterae.AAC.1